MKLITIKESGTTTLEELNDKLIETTIRGLDPFCEEIAILEIDDMTYIQTLFANDEESPYGISILLEYQEGDLHNHYLCQDDISIEQIVSAFISYLHSDGNWQERFTWQHFPL